MEVQVGLRGQPVQVIRHLAHRAGQVIRHQVGQPVQVALLVLASLEGS